MEEELAQIRQFIADGKTKKALEAALALAVQYKQLDEQEPTLLLGRWNKGELDNRKNLISDADWRVEQAKITDALLTWVSENGGDLSSVPPQPKEAALPDFGDITPLVFLWDDANQAQAKTLGKHLFQLQKTGYVFVDALQDIQQDAPNAAAVHTALLENARLALALVSVDSMVNPEFHLLAEQALAGKKLIPILVEETDLKGTVFEPLAALPANGQFINQSPAAAQSSIYADIARRVKAHLEKNT